MSENGVIHDFRKSDGHGKLRRVALGVLAVGVVVGTVVTVRAILRLHWHAVPDSPEVEAKLQHAEAAAEAAAAKENAKHQKTADAKQAAEGELGAHGETDRPVAGAKDAFPFPYEIRGMVVPIANRRESTALYAQFSIVFDCPSEAAKETMELSRAKIRSRLFEVAMRFGENDFRTKEGFERFHKAILVELKDAFGEHAPRGVSLRDWMLE
jgi:flagellar basal body-associated protein FliL